MHWTSFHEITSHEIGKKLYYSLPNILKNTSIGVDTNAAIRLAEEGGEGANLDRTRPHKLESQNHNLQISRIWIPPKRSSTTRTRAPRVLNLKFSLAGWAHLVNLAENKQPATNEWTLTKSQDQTKELRYQNPEFRPPKQVITKTEPCCQGVYPS